jgi:hypothetical protein
MRFVTELNVRVSRLCGRSMQETTHLLVIDHYLMYNNLYVLSWSGRFQRRRCHLIEPRAPRQCER